MALSLYDRLHATIAYADIFDFPLTPSELQLWCIGGNGKIPLADNRWYFLKRRKQIIAVRYKRRTWSKPKWRLAKRVSRFLSFIPTVRLVGVTGGLAMDNAKKQDDVDLFFITSAGTLWTTRLLATLLVEALGVRRQPHDRAFADKICLNMFMAEDALTLPQYEQDLFAAHEVLQMVPLWKRGGAYKKFLSANRWVRKFLPNAWDETHQKLCANRTYKIIRPLGFVGLFRLLEPFARAAQFWYMKRHRTTEVISRQIIRFHPSDARVWVKRELGQRLRSLKIPLDKVFYAR